MPETVWEGIDILPTDELQSMPAAVNSALRHWCFMEHGLMYSRHYVGHFLDLLAEEGYTVERLPVASARSYTTIETMEIDRSTEDHTVAEMKAEDPTWEPPSDPDAPVRSLI